MSSIELKRKLQPDAEDLAPLRRRFHEFVQAGMPGLSAENEDRDFLFCLHQGDEFIGAICGSVYWDGLEIDTLWVDDRCRGQGHGRRLVDAAEDFARAEGAVIAFLKTVAARDFYSRLGYETYGVLEDRPIDTLLYHMKKRLDNEPGGPAK